jgi:TRAP-type C4-dicarboxylate transport system permease small subunit
MTAIPAERPGPGDDESILAREIEAAQRELELADPDAGLSRFDRIVNRTAEAFGVFLLALLTGLVFLNASARYLVSHSFIWGDELVIAMIPWLAMAGLFLAVRRRNVIRIDFFVDKFPPGPRRVFRLFADLLSAAMFAYLGYVSIEYVQLFGGDRLTYLRWPTGLFSASFVIGPFLAGLAYLYAFWREARGEGELPARAETAP